MALEVFTHTKLPADARALALLGEVHTRRQNLTISYVTLIVSVVLMIFFSDSLIDVCSPNETGENTMCNLPWASHADSGIRDDKWFSSVSILTALLLYFCIGHRVYRDERKYLEKLHLDLIERLGLAEQITARGINDIIMINDQFIGFHAFTTKFHCRLLTLFVSLLFLGLVDMHKFIWSGAAGADPVDGGKWLLCLFTIAALTHIPYGYVWTNAVNVLWGSDDR